MSVLADTNVLLRSTEPQHPMHQVAADSVRVLRQQGEVIVLTPQNIYEFWVAATRPTVQNGLGLTPPAAQADATQVAVSYSG